MKSQVIPIVLLLFGCAWGKPKALADNEIISKAISEREQLSKDQATPAQCLPPHPQNLGCSVSCEPCYIPVCDNGHWKYELFDWGEQCKASNIRKGLRSGS